MAELANLKIKDHPLGIPVPGDFIIFADMVNNVTKKALVNQFLPSPTTQNFEWVSEKDPAYDEDEVVTYGGNWYQSAVDDNTSVPGVNSDWTLLTKSASGFVYWAAGLFTEDKVFVVSEHRDAGYPEIFFLLEPSPFVSVDIVAEELLGQWRSITEITNTAEIPTGPTDIVLPFKAAAKRFFLGNAAVSGDREWSYDDAGNILEYKIHLEISGAGVHTFPINTKIYSSAVIVDGNEAEFIDTGFYSIEAWYDRTYWHVTIKGPTT
jgi:hypothetical protein